MSKLKHFGCSDLTFGQSIGPFGDSLNEYYSCDLSSATDRFPIEISVALLGEMIDPSYAQA
jgi:hypothetical protein